MLRKKLLIFEHLLAILFLLEIFVPPSVLSKPVALSCFSALLGLKWRFEGVRVTLFLIIFAQLMLLVTTSIYINLPLAALMYVAIIFFPVYKYPEPMGKFRVGYKRLVMPGLTNIGVYYPTTQQTQDVKYSPDPSSWKRFALLTRFYAEVFKKRPIPMFLFKIAFDFLDHQYMGVNKDAQITTKETTQFSPVIFCHGLSANIHVYSLHLKEWASSGFIVFSIDHDEVVRLDPTKIDSYEEYYRLRALQIQDRKETIKEVLNYMAKSSNIQALFENDQVTLDYKNLFFTGHSFGGATVSELAVEDKRMTGGLLLLDPWFNPANFNTIYQPINKPMLSIRSHEYHNMEPAGDYSKKHVQANSNHGMCLAGYFKNSFHNSFTDLTLFMPRELIIMGIIKDISDLDEQIKEQTLLSRTFLQVISESKHIVSNQQTDVSDFGLDLKTKVHQRLRENLQKINTRDVFVPDE